jgi:hypothetical protein
MEDMIAGEEREEGRAKFTHARAARQRNRVGAAALRRGPPSQHATG